MKQHEMSENRGLFALAATVVCLTAAISPSFAFGANLINGAFEPRGDEDRTAEVLAPRSWSFTPATHTTASTTTTPTGATRVSRLSTARPSAEC